MAELQNRIKMTSRSLRRTFMVSQVRLRTCSGKVHIWIEETVLVVVVKVVTCKWSLLLQRRTTTLIPERLYSKVAWVDRPMLLLQLYEVSEHYITQSCGLTFIDLHCLNSGLNGLNRFPLYTMTNLSLGARHVSPFFALGSISTRVQKSDSKRLRGF